MKQKTNLESALDELLVGKTPEEITGPNGLLRLRNQEVGGSAGTARPVPSSAHSDPERDQRSVEPSSPGVRPSH
jgi:hypothetical protein